MNLPKKGIKNSNRYFLLLLHYILILLISCMMNKNITDHGNNRRADQRYSKKWKSDIIQSNHKEKLVLYGIRIMAGKYNSRIQQVLIFLKKNEPHIFRFITRYIDEITWEGNPFWSLTHFPDRVSLSTQSFTRGIIYLASLLYHELSHILFFKVRLSLMNDRDYSEVSRFYRKKGMRIEKIHSLSSFEEEQLVHLLQLKFLMKYNDKENIKRQKIILKSLIKTYRHLKKE